MAAKTTPDLSRLGSAKLEPYLAINMNTLDPVTAVQPRGSYDEISQ